MYRELALSSYKSSAILAGERGSFPIYQAAKEKGHPFLERLWEASPEVGALVAKHGRRNIACNTTAPAGTVSLMTQTTSGIEPVFLLRYTRRTRILPTENIEPDFVDEQGDKWQEFEVLHPGLERWKAVTGLTEIEDSPYMGSTSADIDWSQKIKMQAAAQRWIDHAISNTTNIPKDTPLEVTREIYETGWKSGCKGITVYREGCRSGVLVSKKRKHKQRCAPKRPLELPCEIHTTHIKGEKWTILVGLMDGEPYEVFGGLAKYIEIPKKYATGVLVKNPRKTVNAVYDLRFGEDDAQMTIKNIVEVFDNANHGATTRLISLCLRHGSKIQYVVEQLQKERDADMFTFAKVVGRVLKKYIRDGTVTHTIKSCDSCSGDAFAYQEGCVTCISCGWSKCG